MLLPIGILVIVLPLQFTAASPSRGDSLRELRKLMRQQDDERQQPMAASTPRTFQSENQFNEDISQWLLSLEHLGLEIFQFVQQCRLPGSQCQQRRVHRRFRSLRHGYTELRAQLEALEVSYVGRMSSEEAWTLESTMQKVKMVLRQYDETLRLINGQIFKLVDQ
ncbi:uncharacterized protein LOC108163414 [Drosophila miranda]|uniref:uncharacterized protein LOC108163414 n=1 Tax=Drosophila miranda TaxID=7229 RepID=UPI0007E8750F|nr:uncharacterized protein LOC108163414 [Drosophila miranda]